MSDLLDRVRVLADDLGRIPRASELEAREVWRPGEGGYGRVTDLLEAAGLGRGPQRARPVAVLTEDIKQRLRDLAAELGRTPSEVEIRTRRLWVPGRFGFLRVSRLLEAVGLTPRVPGARIERDEPVLTLGALLADSDRRSDAKVRAWLAAVKPKPQRESDLALWSEPSWMDDGLSAAPESRAGEQVRR